MENWEMFADLGADCDLGHEALDKHWKEAKSKLGEFVDSDILKSLSGLYLHGESATNLQFLRH